MVQAGQASTKETLMMKTSDGERSTGKGWYAWPTEGKAPIVVSESSINSESPPTLVRSIEASFEPSWYSLMN